ncbi:hypothetical protein D3C85_1359060 [compost metagenome]
MGGDLTPAGCALFAVVDCCASPIQPLVQNNSYLVEVTVLSFVAQQLIVQAISRVDDGQQRCQQITQAALAPSGAGAAI